MNVLFVSYAEISLRGEGMRSAAMLRALADAGHGVDVVAPLVRIQDHPCIRELAREDDGPPRKRSRMRAKARQAVRQTKYDAVHAVDDAVFFALRLVRWKKIPLVYDAVRRFSGKAGQAPSRLWKAFPRFLYRQEVKVLGRAALVYSSCAALTADLRAAEKNAAVVQLEDVPVQSLLPGLDIDKASLFSSLGGSAGAIVVCDMLPGSAAGLRNVLMAVLKVVEVIPDVTFFFLSEMPAQAGEMVQKLDISSNCVFLPPDDSETFLKALHVAAAALLIPPVGSRYIHPRVYTLLHAPAALVAVHDAAYDDVLTEQTTIPVLADSDSMAAGVLRAIQEPLFSRTIGTHGQQLVADHYSFSTFKHKVRMKYHELFQ